MKLSAKQIARSKPVYKYDEFGKLFLVGYERKNGLIVWLQTPAPYNIHNDQAPVPK